MTKLLTTSVVRGSNQGESHGGVYLLDIDAQQVEQKIDWNTTTIDWRGRGADRGLRGIAFDGDVVYIAASDELFAYTPKFELIGSWQNAYLKHCHESCVYERTLYLTSTGFDSILCFDLDKRCFDRGIHIETQNFKFKATIFDSASNGGPLLLNKLHLNNVHCTKGGMYVSGLKSGGMLHFNGQSVFMSVELPAGTHNARPYRDGVLFNDTRADRLRYSGRGDGAEDRAMALPTYDRQSLTHTNLDDSRTARQGFARGLCVISDSTVAVGSSPSTISVYDLAKNKQLLSVNLTLDVRNAIHGLEVWPFE
ncbi:MAG: hypothetical protein OSB26_11640 [Woeseiaceae bacterium]|jgi:hypothetical protein|nr:hypothetical protein [Woeseiaceae bacterium]